MYVVPVTCDNLAAMAASTSSRAPSTPAPHTTDEILRASAIDAGIDFDEKDEACADLRSRKSGFLDRTTALEAYKNLPSFLHRLPKAELHVHIEGTISPERVRSIAVRNGLPNLDDYDPAKDAISRQGYREGNDDDVLTYCEGENALNAFLTQYNKNSTVYRTSEDYYDVAMDYLKRAVANGVVRAEIMFDPQTHCFEDASGSAADPDKRDPRGVGAPKLPFDTVLDGLWRAVEEGRSSLGIDAGLILCFLQDRSTEEAEAVLDLALPRKDRILAVGMDNGTGPWGPGSTVRFRDVYARAKSAGLRLVAHAGEEEGAACVSMCLNVLECERIDHGVRSLEDPRLIERLARDAVPLTCCPLSNHRLQIHSRHFCGECPIRTLLEAGVKATINSDDPAYFCLGEVDSMCQATNDGSYDGYVSSNYLWAARMCGLTPDDCVIVARNSLEACFVDDATREGYVERLRAYCDGWRAG